MGYTAHLIPVCITRVKMCHSVTLSYGTLYLYLYPHLSVIIVFPILVFLYDNEGITLTGNISLRFIPSYHLSAINVNEEYILAGSMYNLHQAWSWNNFLQPIPSYHLSCVTAFSVLVHLSCLHLIWLISPLIEGIFQWFLSGINKWSTSCD